MWDRWLCVIAGFAAVCYDFLNQAGACEREQRRRPGRRCVHAAGGHSHWQVRAPFAQDRPRSGCARAHRAARAHGELADALRVLPALGAAAGSCGGERSARFIGRRRPRGGGGGAREAALDCAAAPTGRRRRRRCRRARCIAAAHGQAAACEQRLWIRRARAARPPTAARTRCGAIRRRRLDTLRRAVGEAACSAGALPAPCTRGGGRSWCGAAPRSRARAGRRRRRAQRVGGGAARASARA